MLYGGLTQAGNCGFGLRLRNVMLRNIDMKAADTGLRMGLMSSQIMAYAGVAGFEHDVVAPQRPAAAR